MFDTTTVGTSSQNRDLAFVSMHGGSYPVPNERMDEALDLLADDLYHGRKIPLGFGASDIAFSEVRRHDGVSTAVFDLDPVLPFKLDVGCMKEIARDVILPTLRIGFPAELCEKALRPGVPAIAICMGARLNQSDGSLELLYKETKEAKCGRCSACFPVTDNHPVWQCKQCDLKFDSGTGFDIESNRFEVTVQRVYKSGAHFRTIRGSGLNVNKEGAYALVAKATQLLNQMDLLPANVAEFDSAQVKSGGLRLPMCPKAMKCMYCTNNARAGRSKKRSHDGSACIGCPYCQGRGKGDRSTSLSCRCCVGW